jgi:hypothetical protein
MFPRELFCQHKPEMSIAVENQLLSRRGGFAKTDVLTRLFLKKSTAAMPRQ